jgi:hypothetical protein
MDEKQRYLMVWSLHTIVVHPIVSYHPRIYYFTCYKIKDLHPILFYPQVLQTRLLGRFLWYVATINQRLPSTVVDILESIGT